jgi:hypothetical protein
MRQCGLGIDEEMKSPRAQKLRVRGYQELRVTVGHEGQVRDEISRYHRCLGIAIIFDSY